MLKAKYVATLEKKRRPDLGKRRGEAVVVADRGEGQGREAGELEVERDVSAT
jgi:hypothetical protein